MPVSGETYSWSISGGTIVSGQNTPSIKADWGAFGNGFVGVKATAYDPRVNDKECSSQEFKLPVVKLCIRFHQVETFCSLDTEPDQCQDNVPYLLQTQLQGAMQLGDSLEIQVNNGLSFQTLRNANGIIENIEISKNKEGTYNIRARIISAFGCMGPWDEVTITINPKPVNTVLIGNDVICFPPKSEYEYQVTGLPTAHLFGI